MAASITCGVFGPNQTLTKPSEPSSARSSGGSESACQNAAWAECEKMSSSQALLSVRPITRRTAPRPVAGSVAGAGSSLAFIARSG